MIKEEAKHRIEKLRKLIDRHRYLYHVEDREEISDEAFDTLKHELWKLEQEYPDLITPDSPTQRVGGEPVDKFEKVAHSSPMISIEDIFTQEELESWEEYILRLSSEEKLEYFTELKIDGLAVSIVYQNGVFLRGATRGNGRVGEDVTQNLKTIQSIPLRLKLRKKLPEHIHEQTLRQRLEKGEIEIRGEVYIDVKDFEQLNEKRLQKGEEPFANPRNLAAGSIRQLDPKLTACRPLKFMAYSLVSDMGQEDHAQEHGALSALGLRTDKTAKICKTLDEVISYRESIGKMRDSLHFHIDGIVVVVNNNSIFRKLGIAGKSYRGNRAFKFVGKQAATKIVDIITQIGRTGAVTPVALLDPIEVGGVTISRATLHNEDEIRRLGVKIGDTVVVERAGDVIPRVVQVLMDLRTGSEKMFSMPKKCPRCDSLLVREEGEAVTRCPNKQCQEQKLQSLYHFASRKAFDIDGLGPKVIDQLLDAQLVETPADFFRLTKGDLMPLERFGEKSSSNLISSIEQSKKILFSRFIYALGIRHIGEETALDLAYYFGSLNLLQKASIEELEGISDIGSTTAKSILEWFANRDNQKLLGDLLDQGVIIEYVSASKESGALKGMTFVLTGTLEMLTREEAKKQIRNLGGDAGEAVSSRTSYVVAGKNPGSKLEKAKKLGLNILNEQQFLDVLKKGGSSFGQSF
ncbi:MAG: hypothetical protein A3E07_02190 [Candidatus Wildermuthbacteria bacterium RIFCSPHIGHO2_12_FULL_45_9]|uniref:DNA ligase n=1 Tax=Candidatus Wildermuthbacteria bacterium RIFCSPHIGHO2_02_FULL_45_25 TaxID=1802450 RepID=A0A1G2R463_9BACT|nr:MAG: hypothetical protein A2748_01480 [Candidatus Wildermuthbacteria bacterium RIFCSPHIGHO2_01_FULL_45_20]OHA66881.1 MAG: hypothetical protein A3C04_02465 [Candidatus Wildermuthbacteria bacterium RIFCSPHIGHO2_02_FULL_45_25]OHA72094.1 MAG: hypothetical protein A3E07_02190 [Candidatus Wildermuthbacteria bacterium RIFCSPHIGHO2_12_FULL_45_9]